VPTTQEPPVPLETAPKQRSPLITWLIVGSMVLGTTILLIVFLVLRHDHTQGGREGTNRAAGQPISTTPSSILSAQEAGKALNLGAFLQALPWGSPPTSTLELVSRDEKLKTMVYRRPENIDLWAVPLVVKQHYVNERLWMVDIGPVPPERAGAFMEAFQHLEGLTDLEKLDPNDNPDGEGFSGSLLGGKLRVLCVREKKTGVVNIAANDSKEARTVTFSFKTTPELYEWAELAKKVEPGKKKLIESIEAELKDRAEKARVASPRDISTLSTPALMEAVEASDARIRAAFGEHRRVTIRGQVYVRGEGSLSVVGIAVPQDGDFRGFGIHTSDACLFIAHPHGTVMAGYYIDENLYYLKDTTSKNALGWEVPCSVYVNKEDLPAGVLAALRRASDDLRPLWEELKRRDVPQKVSVQAKSIHEEEKAALRQEKSAPEHGLGAEREEVARAAHKKGQRGPVGDPASSISVAAPAPVQPRTPAEVAWESGDWNTAFLLYSKPAEAGDPDAQVRIGRLYYDGLGRAPDLRLAEQWYRKAAEKGNGEAKYRLGLLYSEDRKGALWDLALARRFLEEAAQTHADAATKLGAFYRNGIGVPEDREQARKWYERAAKLGSVEAADWLRANR